MSSHQSFAGFGDFALKKGTQSAQKKTPKGIFEMETSAAILSNTCLVKNCILR